MQISLNSNTNCEIRKNYEAHAIISTLKLARFFLFLLATICSVVPDGVLERENENANVNFLLIRFHNAFQQLGTSALLHVTS